MFSQPWAPPEYHQKTTKSTPASNTSIWSPRDSQSEYSWDLGHLFASKMTSKMTPKSSKIKLRWKLYFCNPSNTKRLFFMFQTPQNLTKIVNKTDLKTGSSKIPLFLGSDPPGRTKVTPNAAKMTPNRHPKSPQNRQKMTPYHQQACPEDT